MNVDVDVAIAYLKEQLTIELYKYNGVDAIFDSDSSLVTKRTHLDKNIYTYKILSVSDNIVSIGFGGSDPKANDLYINAAVRELVTGGYDLRYGDTIKESPAVGEAITMVFLDALRAINYKDVLTFSISFESALEAALDCTANTDNGTFVKKAMIDGGGEIFHSALKTLRAKGVRLPNDTINSSPIHMSDIMVHKGNKLYKPSGDK